MRLFIAINFSKELLNDISDKTKKLKNVFPDLKWVRPQAMHLTLKFLGETQLEPTLLKNKLETALSRIDSFTFTTTQVGFFPGERKPRVYYLGITLPEELNQIYKNIEQQFSELGFPKENRPFKPHITLARIKNTNLTAVDIEKLKAVQFDPYEVFVSAVDIMKSKLNPSGAEYTIVQKCALN